jgi:hypothetical protein
MFSQHAVDSEEGEEPTITLLSSEGDVIKMNISAAKMSPILNEILIINDENEENGEENDAEAMELPIKTAVLKKVIEYCNYHSEEPTTLRKGCCVWKKKTFEELDRQFIDSMDGTFSYFAVTKDLQRWNSSMLFDLLLAANFLHIESLLDLAIVKVASMLSGVLFTRVERFQRNTIGLIDTLPVEMQLQIYSHRTYAQHAQLADKIQSTALGETKAQSTALGETIELRTRTMARDGVRVPQDCQTLKAAIALVESNDRLTTIVLGKGKHFGAMYGGVDNPSYETQYNTLEISSLCSIVGDPSVAKEEIVVVGGIWFKIRIQGTCHLQHLTINAAVYGVIGLSSYTMEDVLVEQCETGVVALGTDVVVQCTNVEVRQCVMSGVVASHGASITLIGPKTSVHQNCTEIPDYYDPDPDLLGDGEGYGLAVFGFNSHAIQQVSPFSTIQLVSPLTKDTVSKDNRSISGQNRNWGADEDSRIDQIKTIPLKQAMAEAERLRA